MIKKVDSPPYIIDEKILTKFNDMKTVFGRMLHDDTADFYQKRLYDNIEDILSCNREGYSRIDFAKVMSSWTVYNYFEKAFSWERLSGSKSVMTNPKLKKFSAKTKTSMTSLIKETAHQFGASIVGITKLNHRWIYTNDRKGDKIEVPNEYKYAIVMAFKMDPLEIATSPKFKACSETGLVYSRIAFCLACTAEFIRHLGYNAIPMGNDTALSIPLAIDAGLGELGRNGLLITPEYGPCVRICKVFTDMPLETDKPIEFGVTEFCKNCSRCVEACEAEAIEIEREPSFETKCQSNNPGVLKWAVNHDKCYHFWLKNGGDCSNCIASCYFFPSNEKTK